MAIFNNMTLTTKGQLLYVKAQAGQEIKFTKMMVGSGDIDSRNPATLLALIEPKFDVGIQSITPNTEQKIAVISGKIDNSSMIEATYICEIGLFAEDPDDGEVLYAYGTAGKYGDYYAPATSGPFSWSYDIEAAIGNAANVTVELSNLTFDYGVKNTNTTFIVISGGNQKEINKSIDKKLSELAEQSKDIANNKASKTELEDLKNTVANIDLSATKVNLATINGMSAKNVQSGIQELFTFASNGKNAIAGKVGNITGNNTHAEIANRIQTDKNTTASNLNSKGVSASGNEALASLVSKIANISIQGMGGKNFLEGVINHTNGTRDEIFLNFNAGSITVDQPNSSYSQYPYVCITKVGGSFYPFQSSNSVSGIYYDSTKKILSISSSVSTGNFPFNAWGE
ncbi:hypothetical protein U728_3793 (plasmid) [Clostridium botulinum 202F]|nr:hypothetical protein U728_3793 [Clostridium botulinum 202F]KAI3344462.1 hypothetical protein CIT17_16955 [Clostridium botulinum]MBY6987849.1 hypothetical protein [Clostridium botulinum]NFH01450.1 hypothetical protein [Clostridium botulinum]NFQ57322.1 hypothetical protein [Clostridium botulinum]